MPIFLGIACGTIQSKDIQSQDTSQANADTGASDDQNDTDDSSLYEIPDYPAGVSTLAGSGEYTSIDGSGLGAAFSEPKAIRMNKDGTLIVADSGTGKIRTVELDGQVKTLQARWSKSDCAKWIGHCG